MALGAGPFVERVDDDSAGRAAVASAITLQRSEKRAKVAGESRQVLRRPQ